MIDSILKDLEVMGEPVVTQPELLPRPLIGKGEEPLVKKRKRSVKKKSTDKKEEVTVVQNVEETFPVVNSWEMRPPADAPFVSWTEAGIQYTVFNPSNRGRYLLKLQLFDGLRPINSCGVYLNGDNTEHTEIKILTMALLDKVENLWVDRKTGVGKNNNDMGLMKIASPISAWGISDIKGCTIVKS